MYLQKIYIAFFLIHSALIVAQQHSNLHCRRIPANQEIELDTLSVYAPSISLGDTSLKYEFVQSKNTIKVNASADSIDICYRVFPFNLTKKFAKEGSDEYLNRQYYSTKNSPNYRYTKPPLLEKEELFSFNTFNKSGNFTRGISVGNNQNAFVNSSLNLQLSGQISENMKLTGAISDQNMPIQPNGYTQNIQQFDRVYLQLEQDKVFTITAGDYVLKNRPEGYFLKYLKNVQGLQAQYHYRMAEKDTAHTTVGVSFAKGKFSSIQLLGTAIADTNSDQVLQEGVLGPYRLTGPNKERFVQVIANSEKIFLDGRELLRGFNNDYVIDYNSGEIRFTPNVLITKYSRVRIDFEYTDRNYARSNYQLSHEQSLGKFTYTMDYYSEKDNSRSPLAITLNDADKERLSQVGDTLERAFVESGDSVGYVVGAILYKLVRDTVVNGINYSNVYVFSNNPSNAFNLVSFSFVGQGNGDYAPSSQINNGRVYEWIAPQNGVKQGSYLPQRIVPTPKQKNMFTAGLKYQINAAEKVYTEVAVSKEDLNLYSQIDDGDNTGKALKIGYENKGRKFIPKKRLQYFGGLDLEVLDRNFVPMDRYRPVDFDRDWNASATTETNNLFANKVVKTQDQIITMVVGIKDSLSYIKYTSVLRNKEDDAKGSQQRIEFQKKYKLLDWKASYFTMNNNLLNSYANWQKINSDLSLNFNTLKQGYIYEKEDNRQYARGNDSIIRSYQNYYLHRLYLHSGDSLKKLRFKVYTEQRQDYLPYQGRIVENSFSRTQNFVTGTKIKKNHDINLTTTLRNTENQLLINSTVPREEQTLIGRLDLANLFLKKSIKSELTFATSTGRELRREYIYIPVPTGQGNFAWRDDNQDGIQQLNEFYEAVNFDEKNYLKTFVPTNEYISSYASNYIYKLNLTPPVAWRKKSSFIYKQLYKLSSNTYYTLDKSSLKNDFLFRISPFYGNLTDESLLYANANFRNSLFWNRQSSKFGVEYNFSQQLQKQLLSNGFEGKRNILNQIIARKNIGSKITLRAYGDLINRNSSSDYLENRNYEVKGYKLKPEFVIQPNNNLRLTLNVAYGDKTNEQSRGIDPERSQNYELGFETRYSKVSSRTVQLSFKYNKLNYNAAINTPLAYEMLEALQPGDNYYWNISYTQKVLNGLQLTINYDGRQSGNLNIVHIGKIQATALF